ncbi:MAG: hypothetical protein LKE40_03425 [Spirochaetia bacterium]|nr:hypothetical protein [Spirochaetia bacterium]
MPPEERGAQRYAALACGLPQGKPQGECLQVGLPGFLAVLALVSHRTGGRPERTPAIPAEIPLLAPDEAVATDMDTGAVGTTRHVLGTVPMLVGSIRCQFGQCNDPLAVLFR